MGECKEAHSASKVLVTPRRKRIAKVEEEARIDMATVYLVDDTMLWRRRQHSYIEKGLSTIDT